MKIYMVIRRKVSDFAKFQEAFDRLMPGRSKAGLTDIGQFCAAEDTNTVIILLRVETGIVGTVEAGGDQVSLTDGLVKDRLQHTTH